MSGHSVMIFCPTWTKGGRDQIHPDTLESIRGLQWAGETEFIIGRLNPYPFDGPNKLENVLAQYRNGREIFLESEHDAMLTVEHDMIIPPNALELLWSVDAPVVYGVYVLRRAKTVLNTWRYTTGRGLGMSLTLFPDELQRAFEQVTPRISGVGFGCTLIRREPLERISMRRAKNGGHPSPDVPFAEDCILNGFEQRAHFGVPCGHIKPSGEVLYPFVERSLFMSVTKKYLVLSSVNARIAGIVTRFDEGSTIELPEAAAAELLRAGYLREIKPKRAPAKKRATTKKVN